EEIPDDRRLIDEIFLRFLARPATASEAEAALRTFTAPAQEHERLRAEAVRYEEEIRPALEERERARQAEIAALLEEKAAREAAIAPERAELERQRQERIAAAEAAVAQVRAKLSDKLAAWEVQQRNRRGWQVLPVAEATSS